MYNSSFAPGGIRSTSKVVPMPLVFVPTPLGNLRDITLRSLDALRECSLLVAEDSRVARKLLSALQLPGKEIWSYREQNAATATQSILDRARLEFVAVVTDAGMPGISDPGSELVATARRQNIAVEVLPGPSAFVGAAVLSGFDLRQFSFEGFPPRSSSQRKGAFGQAFARGVPSIWYESPQRIGATLADISSTDAQARVFLVREYSKHFEQQILGTAAEVAAALVAPIRGEISFVVAPSNQARSDAPSDAELFERIDVLLGQGLSAPEIAKTLVDGGYGERRRLYGLITARKSSRRGAPAGGDKALSP